MTDPLAEQDDASTPLSPEEREGLIPSYITLRGELNEAEQANKQADEAKQQAAKADDELAKAKASSEQATTESEKAKAESDLAQAATDKANAEADQAKAETDKAKAEADQAKAESDKAKAEADAEKSQATIAVDCAKSYVSALGGLFQGGGVRKQAPAVRDELRKISADCKNALQGT